MGGEKVDDHRHAARCTSATYSLAETFDIGRDTGTQVSRRYDGPNPFQGDLDRVVVTLTGEVAGS